jgi:hypothetical protein
VSLRDLIRDNCEYMETPRRRSDPIVVRGYHLPTTYAELLNIANGFVLKHQTFRFFGVDPMISALDLHGWNQSPWIGEYGNLAAGIVFIAEDIFGDQYGLRFTGLGDRDPAFVKFWCEGGETETIASESLAGWLASSVLRKEPTILDWELASAAFKRGLTPSGTEHLSYSLPLIVGGDAHDSNIEVADRVFHLHLLGQLSVKNRKLPEGERIRRFWPES